MEADFAKRFTHHTPKDDQPERYKKIRDLGYQFAHAINDGCPDSREKSLSITKLEETVMWACKAIAQNE
ncbi:hypothetical protein LCGC14_0384510 [marine sediment metagenome]|uniref:Acb2/Tad1 hairpin domain-containing protein n=1 Tax=marine sediment metagenome TaxID=412755 RepID=A0A0F9TJJ4_9ZZZZ